MNKITFISMPYNHTDPNIIDYRIKWSKQLVANAVLRGETYLSPGQMGHDIINAINTKDMTEDTSFAKWSKYCFSILYKSDYVIFCLLPEFEKSTGMKAEYEEVIKLGIPHHFIDKDYNVVFKPDIY